jgi:diguanylate cyclase (GGDEF)-like protein
VSAPAELRRQALLDLERRTFAGSQTYLPFWLGVAAGVGLLRTETVVTALVAAMFAITSVARVALHRRFAALVVTRVALAEALFRSLLLAGSAQFGVVTAASLVWPPLRPAQTMLILTALVVCTAATIALSLDSWSRFGLPIAFGGPVTVALALPVAHASLIIWFLVPAFYLYLLLTSRYVRDDYWEAARAGLILTQRAMDLERLSVTDTLTQIANRLAFDRRLEQEWARALRDGRLLSLLILDVDHFKQLNDTYGHPMGDRYLVELARTLEANLYRPVDLVARYGGEEFIVLLPDTGSEDATMVAERLRVAVAALVVDHDGRQVRFTCSIGTSTVLPRPGGPPPSRAIAVADQALYRAKSSGRDRVAVGEALVQR